MKAESYMVHEEERRAARLRIGAKARPFKPFPDKLQQWRLQYLEDEERYQCLVLFGPSQTGKSRLARHIFGDDVTLVVDVQHAAHPDLHMFRRPVHKAILFDEVASPQFVVSNKKVLQAHIDGAILGQSATQLYTYEVFLWKVPLMLTTNNWDYGSYTDSEKNWIETNCVSVSIDSPVWMTPGVWL
jgi:hypothetical protein